MSKFWYLKYYNIKEAIILLWALFIDSLHCKIPKQVFIIKNTYEFLRLRRAEFSRKKDEVTINFDSSYYKLRLTGSDFEVFNQIILQEELKTVLACAQEIKNDVLQIVDCGANIGLSSLIFKQNFPNAKILSIEPEPSNYIQLCKNIEINNLSNVTPIQAGVWYKETVLTPDLSFRDKSNWSFALKEANEYAADGIKVNSLSNFVSVAGWKHVDLLKIDIEGSEFDIFRNLSTWQHILETVKVISIEVHEERGSIDEIEKILLQNGFHLKKSGELLIGVRN
jgi:FkbM family methyltransferase